MTLVDADTGEIVEPPPFTEIEASAWASSVAADWVALTEGIIEGYQRRAWLGLGYGSWAEMCAELDLPRIEDRELRRELVGSMRGEGMSTRAIGAALGASHQTVQRDLPAGPNGPADQPAHVTGADGKTYPATRPAPEVEDIAGETVLHDPDPQVPRQPETRGSARTVERRALGLAELIEEWGASTLGDVWGCADARFPA